MYSVNFLKKTEQSESTPGNCSDQYSAVFRSRFQRDSFVLKSIKRSVIIIGRSMFDVLLALDNVFSAIHCSGQTEFIRAKSELYAKHRIMSHYFFALLEKHAS